MLNLWRLQNVASCPIVRMLLEEMSSFLDHHYDRWPFAEVVKIDEIADRIQDVGKSTRFGCALQSGENAEFLWTHEGQVVKADGRHLVVSSMYTSTLVIKEIQQIDHGLYTCIAKNDVSEDRVSARLTVKGDACELVGRIVIVLLQAFYVTNLSYLFVNNKENIFCVTLSYSKVYSSQWKEYQLSKMGLTQNLEYTYLWFRLWILHFF